MEPKNKDSLKWKEWFVRHKFGASVAIGITMAEAKELDILIDFAKNIQKIKQEQKGPSNI